MPIPTDDRTTVSPGPPAIDPGLATTPHPGQPQTGTLPQDEPPADAPANWPTVPGYRIERELGRGGMGVVYQATQLGLNRPVAIKMILAGPYATRDAVRRFRAEAGAIAKLKHPNVVQVYDIGEAGGQPFFVLEFVGGGSLDRRLRDGPLPVEEAVGLAAHLADAVAAAHAAGIVHRDLKPGNVLLASGGRKPPVGDSGRPESPTGGLRPPLAFEPKITDFGLAKDLGDQGLTATGTVLGTPAYMAPEQAAGKAKEIGPAADIYALGAILYEMLTGEPPFKGESVLSTLDLVRNAQPEPVRRRRREVPANVEAVCLKCLEKRPADRYPSAAALAADLRRIEAGERPTGARGRVGPTRRRAAITAGVLLALAVAAVAGFRRSPAAVVAPAGPTGGLHAVLVAVDEYVAPGQKVTWQFADRDVTELARVLNESWGVPRGNLRVLTRRHAAADPTLAPTGANVLAELRRLRDRCGPDAVALVALCGSGLQAATRGPTGNPLPGPTAFHFVPAGGDAERPETLLSELEVAAALAECPARAKLVLVDACRGVKAYPPAVRLRATASGRPGGGRGAAGPAFFYACRAGEQSHEDAVLRHGVFTRGVLSALEDGADEDRNGHLELGELERFTTEDVCRSVERLKLPQQRPELVGGPPRSTVILTRAGGSN